MSFGGEDALVCLFFTAGTSTATTGGAARKSPEGCHYSCRGSRCDSVVLVEEPAKFVAASDLALGRP
jgi:hypothetical protein